jgi:hypothetical protein
VSEPYDFRHAASVTFNSDVGGYVAKNLPSEYKAVLTERGAMVTDSSALSDSTYVSPVAPLATTTATAAVAVASTTTSVDTAASTTSTSTTTTTRPPSTGARLSTKGPPLLARVLFAYKGEVRHDCECGMRLMCVCACVYAGARGVDDRARRHVVRARARSVGRCWVRVARLVTLRRWR